MASIHMASAGKVACVLQSSQKLLLRWLELRKIEEDGGRLTDEDQLEVHRVREQAARVFATIRPEVRTQSDRYKYQYDQLLARKHQQAVEEARREALAEARQQLTKIVQNMMVDIWRAELEYRFPDKDPKDIGIEENDDLEQMQAYM